MFYLYHHHDLNRLAELLAALRSRHAGHPLAGDTVLVPEPGVARWLQAQLAANEGIAAGLEFPVPARYFWRLIRAAMPGAPDTTAYTRRRMRWHLYALLPGLAARQPRLDAYLSGATPELHRWQLANRLADLFDGYLIHRGDMLAAWERGEDDAEPPADWQAPAWRALVERVGRPQRHELLEQFISACAGVPGGVDTELDRAALPERLYCFGLGQLPADYLRLLYALAGHTDVHFLLPNPSAEYWGDIQRTRATIHRDPRAADLPEEEHLAAGHPLLAALGRPARDLLRLLYSDELTGIHEPDMGEAMAYHPPGEATLLHKMQSGIIRMDAAANARDETELADYSVQIHACHGRLREVQVLHDQILDRMSRDPTLEARHIAVLLPDVAAYAPAIHAVFGADDDTGTRGGGTRRIPYAVADCPRLTDHPVARTFLTLLELPLSRWTASEILALAAVPAIMRRFGLDDADLDNLQRWTVAAGVRWGLDAGTRHRLDAGEYAQNTWLFGLDRLLLGAAQSDDRTLSAGVAPWSGLEGSAASAVGKLWLLLDELRASAERFTTPATPDEWQDRLNGAVAALFAPDPEDRHEEQALGAVRDAIAVLGEARECVGEAWRRGGNRDHTGGRGGGPAEQETLHWEAVRDAVAAELSGPGERQPFLGDGVTFCGLIPLRAVPFRMICLLGMDDDAFPREERHREINLIHRNPRLGDPSTRDDDRLLFLQSLLAAGEIFYLSYTGQDVRSGEQLPPSPVVGELLDFIHAYYSRRSDRDTFITKFVTHQPMQPFSRRYFEEQPAGADSSTDDSHRDRRDERLFTFAAEWQPATAALDGPREAAAPFVDGGVFDPDDGSAEPVVVELNELRRFLRNPPAHFFQERARLRIDPAGEEIPDEEPLVLDGLTAWALRDELFEEARGNDEPLPTDTPPPLLQARGELPPPPLDCPAYAAQAEQVNALLAVWREWRASDTPAPPLEIDLILPGAFPGTSGTPAVAVRLVGRIDDLWRGGLRRIRPGRLSMKHRLGGWVDYLAAVAAGHTGALHLAGIDGMGSPPQRLSGAVDRDVATAELAALCRIYGEGLRRPLPFAPDLAGRYLNEVHGGKSPKPPAAALAAINQKLTDTGPGRDHHADDPCFRLILAADGTLGSDPKTPLGFCALAEAICGALHTTVTEGARP